MWRHFEALSQIPRASGDEGRAVAFVRDFGLALGLDTQVDTTGNVVIRKPASPGMENRPPLALQCHLDMVHQQDEGRGIDFDRDPIELQIDGDWLTARGTTLGADNGIGVALTMAVLAATDLAHPPIEALFTVDEEVGMSGAEAVTADQLSAPYLINLDMESDHLLTIGCAGAVDILVEGHYDRQPLPQDAHLYEIRVQGGLGGHSGLDIHLGRMNAIKLLAEALTRLHKATPLTLTRFDGDGVANVIPARARARFVIHPDQADTLQWAIHDLSDLVAPYALAEPDAQITCTQISDTAEQGFDAAFQSAFLSALTTAPTGVQSMSADVEGLVETSNNLSIALASQGRMQVTCLARSCVESHKPGVIAQVRDCFALTGAQVTTANDAPGWEPRPDSTLLQVMADAYQAHQGAAAEVIAIHAGLETGILSATFPDTEMVSYGPNIKGAHSTTERVQISSVQKVWAVLQRTLASIPPTHGDPR